MNDAQNNYTKGNKPNCSSYRIQVKINGDNLNNIRHETSRHFRNKRGNIGKTKLISFCWRA
jgi:hypothetical protein